MINLKFDKIKVISSIPGRFRANIKELLRNEQMSYIIEDVLLKSKGILSVKPNKNTGNVLIYYDTTVVAENKIIIFLKKSFNYKKQLEIPNFTNKESLIRILFNTLNPITLFKMKYSERIYRNEYMISKKTMSTSIIISSIILLFISNVNKALSILILGYPGILFTISIASYYYASVKLKNNNIYLKNNDCLNLLKDTNTLLMENDIFKSRSYNYNTIDSNLNKIDIQKLVIMGHMANPVNNHMQSIIDELRILGISNIFIVGNDTNGILDYISYYLGINILNPNDLEKQNKYLINNETNATITLINTNESFSKKDKYLFYDLVICLYKNTRLDTLNADINLKYDNIDKLPIIIKLSQFCEEIKVQTENMAIALNSLGMLLVTLNCLTPLSSIFFYVVNTLLMTLTLKLRFSYSKILPKRLILNTNYCINKS
jgi:hypothetical protein